MVHWTLAQTPNHPPEIHFLWPQYGRITEDSGEVLVPVELAGDLAAGTEVTVDYVDVPAPARPATAGEDYLPVAGKLTFSDSSRAQTIRLPLLPDGKVDGTKSIRLVLRNPSSPAQLSEWSIADVEVEDSETDVMLLNTPFFRTKDRIENLLALPDNQLLVIGSVEEVDGSPVGGWFRLDGDSTLDPTFPAPGAAFPTDAYPATVALAAQADGKILRIVMESDLNSVGKWTCLRHLANGQVDPSFNVPEEVTRHELNTVAVDPYGRILVGGLDIVARLLPDGGVDSRFRGHLPSGSRVRGIRILDDGRMLIAGEALDLDASALIRLLADGTKDPTFTRSLMGSAEEVNVFPGGNLLVTATRWLQSADDERSAVVWVLDSEGAIDRHFTPSLSDPFLSSVRAVPLKDGRVLVALNTQWKWSVSSSLSILGTDGTVERTLLASSLSISSLVTLGNGDLVVGGSFEAQMSGKPLQKLARFRILDPSASATTLAYTYPVFGESMGEAQLRVTRVGDVRKSATVRLTPAAAAATAGSDFAADTIEVKFAPLESEKTVTLPLVKDATRETDEDFTVRLAEDLNVQGSVTPPLRVWIKDDDHSGAVRIDRSFIGQALATDYQDVHGVRRNGTGDTAIWGGLNRKEGGWFHLGLFGPDGSLKAAIEPDFEIYEIAPLATGDWLVLRTVDYYANLELRRLSSAGEVVTTRAWAGEGSVWGLFSVPDGRHFLGIDRNGTQQLVRLGADGYPAAGFQPMNFRGYIRSVAVAQDGRIYVAGEFQTANETTASQVIRLYTDGRPDPSFHAGEFAGVVETLLPLAKGRVLVGGAFSSFDNTLCAGLVLLAGDGSVDEDFQRLPGAKDESSSEGGSVVVKVLAPHPEGKVWVGGNFQRFHGHLRRGIALMNQDGSIDAEVDFGRGCEQASWHPFLSPAEVKAILVENDGSLLVGGNFGSFDGFLTPGLIPLRGDLRVIRMYGTRVAGPDGLRIRFTAQPGKPYRLRFSTDLTSWTTQDTITPNGNETEWVIPNAGIEHGFYRLEE